MVKFAKQFQAQLVQEWKSAYVDYKQLKKDIKAVKEAKVEPVAGTWQDAPVTPNTPLISGPLRSSAAGKPRMTRKFTRQVSHGMNRMLETFNSFVSATSRAADFVRSKTIVRNSSTNPNIIKVKCTEPTVVGQYEVYTSELNDAFSSLVAQTRVFFTRLDFEFNKVNHFYRRREKEFIEHYGRLQQQVTALEEIRSLLKEGPEQHQIESTSASNIIRPITIVEPIEVVSKRQASNLSRVRSHKSTGREGSSQEFVAISMEQDCDEIAASTAPAHPQAGSPEPELHMPTVEMAVLAFKKENCDNSSRGGDGGSNGQNSSKPHMRLKIPLTTPGTTIRTLTQSLWEDMLRQGGLGKHGSSNGEEAHFAVSKKNINLAEKMLRTAFVEFYRGLTLLRSYGSLNMVAFAKIVKKFDKVSGYRTWPIYITTVESSYFNTSEKAITLLEEVEALFARAFVKDDWKKARLRLRPAEKRSSHTVTFFLGLFTGGSLAFMAVFAILLDRMLDSYLAPFHGNESTAPAPALLQPESIYLKTVFPLFGVSALIIIHMFMYGINLFYWRKWRINYAFMFDFKQGTELRHREVLMTASILMTILLAAMGGHLALHNVSDSPYVDFVPLGVLMILVVILVFPLNVFYRSSRIFLIISFIHLAFAPLYKVDLKDFFLGDQITSQVAMLRNLQYLICYYIGNFFKTSNADGCILGETYKGLVYLVSLLPYWWRFLQCVRKFVDERDGLQLQNAGKYMSAMAAVAVSIQYLRDRNNIVWVVLFVVASIFATVYQIYWDLWVDWGLLRKNSTNKWLRDNLIMPKAKYWYFFSMIANVILRFAWFQSITRFRFGQTDFQVADFSFAVLEVIRRGIWNFYRMENNHLNNVENYRATKTVPLPFEDPSSDFY